MRRFDGVTVAPVLVACLLAASVAGCALDPSPAPPSNGPASVEPVPTGPGSSAASTSPSAPPTISPPPASASAGGETAAEPALFAEAFGPDVDGMTFQYDADTTATIAGDARLRRDVAAVGVGLYTVTGQQPIEDFGIVSVLRLRDSATDEKWFRSYRDSYDESACEQAGGVVRHAESRIGAHIVFIGSCAGGAFTYHLRTADGLVVSITGVGPKRIGESLAAAVESP